MFRHIKVQIIFQLFHSSSNRKNIKGYELQNIEPENGMSVCDLQKQKKK